MSEVQQTLVLIKPDGVRRNLIGEIISRLEAKGYVVADLKKFTPSDELLAEHYAEHKGKPFYEPLVEFMRSGDVVAIKLEGHRVIEVSVHLLVQPTQPLQRLAPSVATLAATGG